MQYHPVTEKITQLLTDNKCWFEAFEHEPVRTSEEAAKIRSGYTLAQGTKALIVRVKRSGEKKFVMLVVPGDRKFDKRKVYELLNAKDIRFATEEEVAQITDGVLVGGVPPFGNIFGIEVYVDPQVLQHEKIIFNAGDRSYSIAMYSDDYHKIVQPHIADISIEL